MKAALRAELVAALQEALATARAAHEAAVEGATHGEARAENDKDTRGLEQSYVARGQAMRVAELEAGLAAVEKMSIAPSARVSIGALVTTDEGARYYMAPAGGGTVIGKDVTVVTPPSPLGKALLGKVVDDEVEIKKRSIVIASID